MGEKVFANSAVGDVIWILFSSVRPFHRPSSVVHSISNDVRSVRVRHASRACGSLARFTRPTLMQKSVDVRGPEQGQA